MKRFLLAGVIVALCALGAVAQEVITLTTPQTQTATSCTAAYLGLDLANSKVVVEVVLQPVGTRVTRVYDATSTPTGATLLTALNRGNFATNSLIKAVYARLNTDGVCVGAVAGTPQ